MKDCRHRVGQKPPWAASLKAAVPSTSMIIQFSFYILQQVNVDQILSSLTQQWHLFFSPHPGPAEWYKLDKWNTQWYEKPLCIEKSSCWDSFYREPSASPKRIFCPALRLNLKSLGASKISTIVEPKLNSPKCSPFLMGIPSLLLLEMKLKSL